jgi:hypothetical protein
MLAHKSNYTKAKNSSKRKFELKHVVIFKSQLPPDVLRHLSGARIIVLEVCHWREMYFFNVHDNTTQKSIDIVKKAEKILLSMQKLYKLKASEA